MRPDKQAGFTLLELLIILAIIATLAAITVFLLMPDPTRALARDITQLHQQARYESINRNEVMLSTWNHNAQAWQVSVANPSSRCTPGTPIRTASRTSVTADTRQFNGILWQPNGLPLTCSGPGQPVAQQRITLNSGRRSTTITFNSNGKGSLQ